MSLTRRHFLRAGAGAALAAGVAGCDSMPRELLLGLSFTSENPGPFPPPAGDSIDPISHVLNRVGFGPRPEDYARVRSLAVEPWAAAQLYLEEQLRPEAIDDRVADKAVRRFEWMDQPACELFEYKEELLLDEMMRATILRATFSKRQLFEAMVQFWTDHFNIDPSKGDAKWLKPADDRDVIRRHALGKFPELLRASALSPAMLWYLDGRDNRSASDGEKPNENYARELLELHTLGVHGGYTQHDVMEVARCLTGWTVRSRIQFQLGKVEFNEHRHDHGPKTVLARPIPAGLGAKDLDRVLEVVALHPATAHYLATKLCRRFIDDQPPESAILPVASAFLNSRGDIRATLMALFATPEFLQARGTKFKRPFNFIVSALRATNAQTDGAQGVIEYLHRMGHAPFSYPTPDGYPEEAMPWMGTLLWRWNFAVALSKNRIGGTQVRLDKLLANTGGEEGLMAHLLGRLPRSEEKELYRRSGDGLALLLAAPSFQRC